MFPSFSAAAEVPGVAKRNRGARGWLGAPAKPRAVETGCRPGAPILRLPSATTRWGGMEHVDTGRRGGWRDRGRRRAVAGGPAAVDS